MRNFFSSFFRRFSKSNRPRRPALPLRLEALEPRWLLTITAVPGYYYSVLHGQSYSQTSVIDDFCSDSDSLPMSIASCASPAHGSVTMASNGAYEYASSDSFFGTDDFTYSVTDGTYFATGTIYVDVTDQAPVAVNDSYQMFHNQILTVNNPAEGLLANDYDPDFSDTIAVVANSSPAHGSLTLSGNGTFTYTPTTNYVGSDSFVYTMSDGAISDTATVALTVGGDPTFSWATTGTNPSLTALADQTNVEGDTVTPGSLNVTASDPNGYTLQFAAINLPPGMSIDSSTGYISGTVAPEAATYENGVYDATLIVTNDNSGIATANFTWTITSAPPTLDNPGTQSNYSGDSVLVSLTASQYDSDPLSFSATGLPADLSIDPDSGDITGNLALSDVSATSYSVTVTATDYVPATPTTASQTFDWSVAPGTPSPGFTNPGNQINSVGDDVDVLLNATDSGGYPLTVTASGLPSGLTIDPNSGEIFGTLPNGAASGTPYNVTVTASDGQVSTSDSFTWAVSGVSLTSPGDQINLDSTTVSLAIGATDATSTTLTYSASGLPSGLSINSSTGVISGTFGATGDATVTVAASDGSANASLTFNWEVDQFGFDDPANQINHEGSSVSMTLTASDAVGTPTFSVSGLPSGLSLNATTGVISGTLANNAHVDGPYQVTVTADDGSATITQSFVWSVTPEIALVNSGPQGDASGDSVSLAVTATDLSSGTITYSASGLPTGLSINSSSGVISGTVGSGAVSDSPHEVTVTAGDGTYSYSQTFPWTVSTIYLPQPPDQDNLDSDTVSLSLAASYHGMGSVSYSATGIPDGLSLNTSTGLLSGTLTNTADADGPYTLDLTATNGTASTTLTLNWEVDPRVTVDALDDQSNVTGDSVSLTVTAEDGGTDSPTWTFSASGLPSGLSIDSSTGVISGTISASVGTSDTVTVSASDGTGSASQTFTWNAVPVILNVPGDQASVGSASINLTLSADVVSGYSATYSASGLPSGLSINSSTGVISGTLDYGDTGTGYAVSVSATADSVTASQEFNWFVGTVILAPPADQTSTEGGSVSVTLSAGVLSGTLSYSAIDLPTGLSVNSSTGVISGTVAAEDAANGPDYFVTVIASNGTVADSQSFDWTVNPKVVITAVDDQLNTEGDSVSIGVTASDGAATLGYSATGLPGGLTINGTTGLISGTVSSGDATISSYAVDVTVTDGTYYSDVFFGWTIHDGHDSTPVLTNPGTQVNVVGDNVNVVLSASDADSSDTLSYSADGLPDGLDIDSVAGVISGSVAEDALQATPYSVTITVDDGNGGTTTQTFNWLVNDSAMTVTAASLSPTEGVDTGDVTVATFTDTDPNWDPSDFTATVTWGDGSSDVGEVDGANGVYTVTDDHIYNDSGTFALQVSVTDGYATAADTDSAVVGASTITVTSAAIDGMLVGTSVSGTWASFTDTNPQSAAGTYTATIDWGDGSSGGATVTGEDGEFVVSDGHTYSTAGAYAVTVTVSDKDGSSDMASSTAQVGQMYAGEGQTLTVATFTISDTSASSSGYTAVINWGDGNTGDGTISGSGGVFTVQGTHSYAVDSIDQAGGDYTVTVNLIGPNEVTLDSSGDETITTTTTERVVRPPITGYADDVLYTPSVTFSGAVATFTELDDSDPSTEFTAIINWGDGSATTTGTVTGSDGMFEVLGSHSYAAPGNYVFQVDISQAWSSNVLASTESGEFVVAPDPSGVEVVATHTVSTGKISDLNSQAADGKPYSDALAWSLKLTKLATPDFTYPETGEDIAPYYGLNKEFKSQKDATKTYEANTLVGMKRPVFYEWDIKATDAQMKTLIANGSLTTYEEQSRSKLTSEDLAPLAKPLTIQTPLTFNPDDQMQQVIPRAFVFKLKTPVAGATYRIIILDAYGFNAIALKKGPVEPLDYDPQDQNLYIKNAKVELFDSKTLVKGSSINYEYKVQWDNAMRMATFTINGKDAKTITVPK